MNLKLPIILIDNGHGVDTPGKRSPDAVKNLIHSPYCFREYSWTRSCAQGIVDVLQAEGYTAFLLVKENEDIPLKERVARVAAYCRTYGKENVILVSVHVNAAGNGKEWKTARGWSVWTSPGQTPSDDLATVLWREACTELKKGAYAATLANPEKAVRSDFTDKDPDYEACFYLLTKTPCTAVLTENLFQDNKEDVAFLHSDAGLGACIQLHVEGIEKYIQEYLR